MKFIGKNYQCSWGAFWIVDGTLLRKLCHWEVEGLKSHQLNLDTKFKSLQLNEGTAGQVWRTQKIIWSRDISIDMCLPRSADAYSAGLSAGIWFPVKVETTVFGVIELLAENLPPRQENQIFSIENLCLDLGQAFQRIQKRLLENEA